ncbi:MAG: hypothetical protein H8K04_14990 [Nitrospira sp.]
MTRNLHQLTDIGVEIDQRSGTMDQIIFNNFIRASLEMTNAFERDCYFSDLDQLRLENYMAVMRMAYTE